MCTVFAFSCKNTFFGRNMDIEYRFGECITITPRKYRFQTKRSGEFFTKYAMIGMASVVSDFPLYAEAVNEKGVFIAGLNFPSNAVYLSSVSGKKNAITPFELIPYLLGACADLKDVEEMLADMEIIDVPFSENLPNAPLHWFIGDSSDCLTLECTAEGMKLYKNPYGVLTNNPPFPFHCENIRQFMNLSSCPPENNLSKNLKITPFAAGMGAMGLPGDFSSASRFVKTFFCKENSKCSEDIYSAVSQVFHILDSVAMVKGTVITDEGKDDLTLYSCCVDADQGVYYYKSYTNNQITKISMTEERKQSKVLKIFPFRENQNIFEEI